MPVALRVILLLLGIGILNILIWIPLIIWIRRRSAAALAALREEIAASGERIVRGPEPALYRGASDVYSRVNGNGIILLTDRRLIFRKMTGGRVEVPVDEINAVREDKWFLSGYRSGRLHLILGTRQGAEVGFLVRDHAAWMDIARSIASGSFASSASSSTSTSSTTSTASTTST